MRQLDYFLFRTNVSLDSYKTKDEAFVCISDSKKAKDIGREKMAFKERTVSVQDFLKLAISGYCFCNLFNFDPEKPIKVKYGKSFRAQSPVYLYGKNKGGMKPFVKCNKLFKGAQTVFVDIDYTTYQNIPDYLSTLSIPPTCVYMSFSDRKPKNGILSRRFRMVYVFDKILNRKEFVGISRIITDTIIRETGEPMDDDCGTRMSQYMNGVYGNYETYVSNFIYSTTDFPGWEEIAENEDKEIEFDEYMLYQMQHLDYDEFMHYNSWRGYFYRTEKPEWNGLYQLTDENYLAIWYPQDIVTDGHKRRKKLFMNACLRVLMIPDIDPDTLLFNLYVDLVRFFDNSDGVITLDCLKRRVKRALSMPKDLLQIQCKWYIDYWRENRPKFIVKSGIRTTLGTLKRIQQLINTDELDMKYDRSKSVKENMEDGIDVSETTLYRYCKKYGISTNPSKGLTKEEKREEKRKEKAKQIELFKVLYNPQITASENIELMKQAGLKLCEKTFYNYIGKYIPKTAKEEIPMAQPSITYDFPQLIMPELPKPTLSLGNSASIIENPYMETIWNIPNYNIWLR